MPGPRLGQDAGGQLARTPKASSPGGNHTRPHVSADNDLGAVEPCVVQGHRGEEGIGKMSLRSPEEHVYQEEGRVKDISFSGTGVK